MKQDNTKLPIGMQKDIFGRREDLMMSWAERLGNGSSKRVC